MTAGSVVVFLDYQQGILASVPQAHEPLAAAVRVRDWARRTGTAAVMVGLALRAGAPEANPRNRRISALAARAAMREGDEATALAPALWAPGDPEPVVWKRRMGALHGTDLLPLLSGLGATRLVLCGVVTSGAVLSTVRAAADLDYELVVVADACADFDPQVHEFVVNRILPMHCDVVTAAELTGGS